MFAVKFRTNYKTNEVYSWESRARVRGSESLLSHPHPLWSLCFAIGWAGRISLLTQRTAAFRPPPPPLPASLGVCVCVCVCRFFLLLRRRIPSYRSGSNSRTERRTRSTPRARAHLSSPRFPRPFPCNCGHSASWRANDRSRIIP